MAQQFSYISNANPAYIESLYFDYQKDPDSVDKEFQKFFAGFDMALERFGENGTSETLSTKDLQVWSLVQAYRSKANLLSNTNPIRQRKDRLARLELSDFGLTDEDLKSNFAAGKELGLDNPTLENIIAHLKTIYCGSIGIEYMHTFDEEARQWIQEKFERESINLTLPEQKKHRILNKLNESVIFETFLHKKYVGQKRFSLEGGESTIPAIDAMINLGGDLGVNEVVIGMAHRGRLNVLANIMGKTYEHIFNDFEGTAVPDMTMGDGDVKYHLGYSSQLDTPNGKNVYAKLAPNPSHLEVVNSVVEGYTRGKADVLYNSDYDKILPILIHGDAALPGQGVSYEVIQMSQLKGYETGGTIHFIINNQIGFTTDFDDARSSTYCTGGANSIQAPVLHVNGDDADAVVYAAEFAVEYRQKFNKDIFIDMVCYRKHGHNEGDEPKFTQPSFYKLIEKHANPRDVYVKKLISDGIIDADTAERIDQEFKELLEDRLNLVKQHNLPYTYQEPELQWKSLRRSTPKDFEKSPETKVSKQKLDKVLKGIMTVPEGFQPIGKVSRLLKSSQKLIDNGQLDWALAELCAYGTLLLEKHDVRLSGQDSARGTFSHRHAMLHEEENKKEHNRLSLLSEDQADFVVYNSLLSEFAVLGFEYGYSQASPNTLVLWEAQFGDFANGAQTVIDQFIVAAESKWQRMSGLVMLLPHGYEGQGPEHSSARLERFLQACAEFNIAVVNCTTAANFFHVLRRQVNRPFRKPLVVMSPKSLLRHPKVASNIEEFTKGGFQEIIDDAAITDPKKVKKVAFCSGKIYYDLLDFQEKNNRKDVAIVRLEQLYPLTFKQIKSVMDRYKNAKPLWVQEEPANMGAWVYMLSCIREIDWELISRKSSASPATGFNKVHHEEQQDIINRTFA